MKDANRKAKTLTEQALKNSELRYRRLFEAAQDGILILNAETGMIDDVNPYLIKMLGYSRAEFIKKKLWEVGAFMDIEAIRDAFKALQKKGYIRYDDLPLKTKDGRLIQVEFVSNVYSVGDENVIQCNIRDITEQRNAERTVVEGEKRYHTALNNMMEGCQIIDYDWRYIYVNDAVAKHGRKAPVELLMHTMMDVYPGIENTELFHKMQTVMENRIPQRTENEFFFSDGTSGWFELSIQPVPEGIFILSIDITQRKRTQDALQESKLMIENIIDTIPARVFWKDMNLVYLGCNALFARDAGFTDPKEIIGKDDDQMAWRAQSGSYRNDDRQVIESGRGKLLIEEPQTTPEGNTITLLTSKVPLRNLKGDVIGVIGTYTDITEYKQAQAARLESERRFRDMQENIDLIAIMLDRDGRITFCNDYLLKLTGYSRANVLGQDWFELFLPPESDIKNRFLAGIQQGTVISPLYENEILTSSGEHRLISWNNITLKDAEGHIIGTNSIGEDVTDRRQAEKALRESDTRFRALIENSTDAITLLDTKGIAVYDSPAAPGMLGYGPTDWIGKNVFALLHPDDLPEVREIFKNLTNTPNGHVNRIFRVRHKSGTWLWIEMVATNLLAEPGVNAIVLNYRDISARKQAEERINKQLAHLTALSSIDRIIAASLDLKFNLSKILDHVTAELGIDAASILILNPSSQMLEFGAERGFRTKAVRKAQLRLGESYAGRVALEHQFVQIPTLRDDPDNLLLTTLLKGEDFVCYYGVPLIAKGQIKGVLEVFHRAPFEPDAGWLDFLNALAGQTAIALENAELLGELQRTNSELALAYETTLEGWSHALDLRDKETEGHTQRVTEMTVHLARAFGLNEAELVDVRRGALLHDIGKMGVPDHILLKPGELTEQEWEQMRMHPVYAYELLSHVAYLHNALNIPHYHHEKWDGSGYPDGLKGAQIPLVARIFAVVDVWDALISDRPYRPAWTKEKAREYILSSSGTHFDPQVVDMFMKIMPDEV